MADDLNNPPGPRAASSRTWRDDVSAEWTRFTSGFTRENIISNLKTLAWVVPLTLLIWIWAEREQVQRLLTQVKRLSEQSHQYILAFSELTRPVGLQARPIQLSDWLKERVGAHRISSEKSIQLKFELAAGPLELTADPTVLGQASEFDYRRARM